MSKKRGRKKYEGKTRYDSLDRKKIEKISKRSYTKRERRARLRKKGGKKRDKENF